MGALIPSVLATISHKEINYMSEFLEIVQALVTIDINREPTPETPYELRKAWDRVEEAGKKDSEGVWDVLRNGTEYEFSALCNCIPEIGGEFYDDDNLCEIMQIARKRLENPQNHLYLMDGIQGLFGRGEMFDKYWKATEPANTEPDT